MLEPSTKKLILPESIDYLCRKKAPKTLLRYLLSLDYTRPREICKDATDSDHYRLIGCGLCGSVYQVGNTIETVKRAIPDAPLSPDCTLSNEFYMHKKVLRAFKTFKKTHKRGSIKVNHYVEISTWPAFVSKDNNNWWAQNYHLFPLNEQYPEDILWTTLIRPCEKHITNSLIDIYCDKSMQHNARSQDCNRDCLIRPYLGKRRSPNARHKSTQACFGLHNFPLYLDQMQDLRLDTASYALVMADALAVMHWSAQIDAADVEFVLGSVHLEDPRAPPFSEEQSATHMYLLDFNQCQAITMDEAGVDQAVKGFFNNDPYYPRPHTGDKGADVDWNIFSLRYIQISTFLRGREPQVVDDQESKPQTLPKLFLAKVKEGMLERAERKRIAAMKSLDTSTERDKKGSKSIPTG